MKVIDARSGQELTVGSRVQYPDGEWLQLEAVKPGLLRASAVIISCHRNPVRPGFPLETIRQTVPLVVRYMHPAYMFQHVGFIPS